jgi:hypothetical protein
MALDAATRLSLHYIQDTADLQTLSGLAGYLPALEELRDKFASATAGAPTEEER